MNEKSICSLGLAEQQGFEPWRRSPGLRDFEFLRFHGRCGNLVEDAGRSRKIKTTLFTMKMRPNSKKFSQDIRI